MILDFLADFWLPLMISAATVLAAVAASAHAIMYKRDTRAAIAWVGLVWLSPILGAVLYVCFGINRIERRGQRIGQAAECPVTGVATGPTPERFREREPFAGAPGLGRLVRAIDRVTERPLLPGNQVTPLVNGEESYPAMLAAIDAAERSVALCSYIFDNDRAGQEFFDALCRAAGRGVEVRVLIDDVGARYSRPTMLKRLRRAGLKARAFLPTRVPRLFHYANLRNHRKILVADGRVGFTGGTNIREGHRLDWETHHPVQDVHFRVEGPVVAHLQEVFATDWAFCSGETLAGETWFPALVPVGDAWARGIPDGPDEDFEKLLLTLHSAVVTARSAIDVVTPYFLPDRDLITALCVAAMQGVRVRIVLPEKNNLKLVGWATTALLWQLLSRGCRVWYTPPPFDHTKLVLVDGLWTLFGSTNWDPRSLRLNFELNVECYDRVLGGQLAELVEAKIASGREVTLAEVDGRGIPVRLRDGAARLLQPYL